MRETLKTYFGYVSKYLLKHHYKPLLPEAITLKKKQGGFAPMPLFFRDRARRAFFKEFILASGIMDNYLRRDAVEKFLTDYEQVAEKEGGWFWHRQNKALQYFRNEKPPDTEAARRATKQTV